MVTREEAALQDWRQAVEIVAKHYGTTAYRLRRDFRIRLLNATSGRREFSRLVGDQTRYEPLRDCDYGHVISPDQVGRGRTWFIEARRELWESGVDLVSTLIHELLHIIEPTFSEEKVAEIEKEICEIEGIERNNIFGPTGNGNDE
jgi:hypothetical protein